MEGTVLLEEQRGLWIDSGLLRQASLGGQFRVVVREGEIFIQALDSVTSPRHSYDLTANKVQHVLREVQAEVQSLYGGEAPPVNQPYFGGVTWQEYQRFSEEQREAIWNRMYQQFDIEIDDVEERGVHPDASVAG